MDKQLKHQAHKTKKCPYLKGKNYCLRRDDNCNPRSLKCIKNQKKYITCAPVPTETHNGTSNSKYNPFEIERYGNNKNITTLDKYNEVPTINVFKGFLRLDKKYTIDYQMIFKDIQTNRRQSALVAYNKKTKKYYISDVQLKYLHKKGYFPNAIFTTCDDGSKPLTTGNFNEFSTMSLYGYSAGKNGLLQDARRKIIKHIIDNGQMRGYEVIAHLRGLIALREDRTDRDFSVAIEEWESDILFVSEYCKK